MIATIPGSAASLCISFKAFEAGGFNCSQGNTTSIGCQINLLVKVDSMNHTCPFIGFIIVRLFVHWKSTYCNSSPLPAMLGHMCGVAPKKEIKFQKFHKQVATL